MFNIYTQLLRITLQFEWLANRVQRIIFFWCYKIIWIRYVILEAILKSSLEQRDESTNGFKSYENVLQKVFKSIQILFLHLTTTIWIWYKSVYAGKSLNIKQIFCFIKIKLLGRFSVTLKYRHLHRIFQANSSLHADEW